MTERDSGFSVPPFYPEREHIQSMRARRMDIAARVLAALAIPAILITSGIVIAKNTPEWDPREQLER